MNIEYELRYYAINKQEIIKRLQEISAELYETEFLMKRKVYHLAPGKWLRVREEHDAITITLKQITDSAAIDGTQEIEIDIHDKAHTDIKQVFYLFDNMGFASSCYQENYRETWKLDRVKVTIDRWPGLDTLVEIEGPNAESVHDVSVALQLEEKSTCNTTDGAIKNNFKGSIADIYQHVYNISLEQFHEIKHVSFDAVDKLFL
ncbi:MAG: CYTH domain-containing protein [Candidatus Babeliaceae bacterium]